MSTVKPPLTLPLMRPVTISPASIEVSSSSHTKARLAFSRERTVSPKPFSRYSKATFTVSPTFTSMSPASVRNCSISITPSDFNPAFTTITSERISTMTPLTMEPGLSFESACWLASNSSANDSVNDSVMVDCSVEHTGYRMKIHRAHLLCVVLPHVNKLTPQWHESAYSAVEFCSF